MMIKFELDILQLYTFIYLIYYFAGLIQWNKNCESHVHVCVFFVYFEKFCKVQVRTHAHILGLLSDADESPSVSDVCE